MSQIYSLNEQLSSLPTTPDAVKNLLKFAIKKEIEMKPNIKGNVEIFIPLDSNKRAREQATIYSEALRKAGFDIPAGIPLPRRGIHGNVKSEVRYFYDSKQEKDLADNVREQLIRAGIPSGDIKVDRPRDKNDKSAPKGFIQVALTNSAFPTLMNQPDESVSATKRKGKDKVHDSVKSQVILPKNNVKLRSKTEPKIVHKEEKSSEKRNAKTTKQAVISKSDGKHPSVH